jgi:chaperonin cofactor prefoldin
MITLDNLNERKATVLEDIKRVEDAIRQIDEQRVSLQANLYALQGANQQIEFFINSENEEIKEKKEDG